PGVQGLAISVLPLALAAVAQAIVVLSGGIDLSLGSMMALVNVVAATQMQGQSEEFGVAVVLGALLLGLALGAVNGSLIVLTRVSVGRTRILAYTLMGLFAALGGLSLTASTGIGIPVPGPYTLLSVAAVVLGGVSLAGGRGSVFGPILGVIILQLIRTDMTFLDVDTNLATVLQGLILIGVVMIGSLVQIRAARA